MAGLTDALDSLVHCFRAFNRCGLDWIEAIKLDWIGSDRDWTISRPFPLEWTGLDSEWIELDRFNRNGFDGLDLIEFDSDWIGPTKLDWTVSIILI